VFYCICDCVSFSDPTTVAIGLSNCNCVTRKFKISTLDIMHSDMCGPMTATSLSRYVYYVSFIDDFSRKTWIYFLKTKAKYSLSSRNSKPL
jgi:hypothetical protein